MEGDNRDLNQSASGGGDRNNKDITSSHGSEEEEQSDSDSEGATSAHSGAKDSGSNRQKTGRYFTDLSYLDSLSKQERQRIEGEISNGHKPALTVQNILQQLRGVNLLEIKYSKSLLTIPPSKLCELKSAHHSTDEQEAAVVRYWLLRDPLASWREIIRQLDFWAIKNDYGHYGGIADRIRHYAEELTDNTFTHSNLLTVLSHVVDTNKLMSYYLSVPDSVIEKIREHSKDEEQQRHECIHYYLKYSPYSMLGWGYFGGELHYWGGEEAALTATRAFIQRVSEPSMTLANLSSILDGVQDIDAVGHYLQIPRSKQVELRQQYDIRQLHTAWSSYFVSHHPAPSWRIVALALWGARELEALKVVQKLYLEDINLQNLCLENLSSWLKSTSDIDTLPLPIKLRIELKYYHLFDE